MSFYSLQLTESSPAQAFEEPLTLEQVKTFLNLPERSPADEAEDLELEAMISAARAVAETEQGRDLARKQYDLTLDCFPGGPIKLADGLESVDLFRYRDSSGETYELAQDTDYIVDAAKSPGVVLPPYGQAWPTFTAWPSSAVLIRFTCGFGSSSLFWSDGAGKLVKNGMLLLVSAWFTRKIPFQDGAAAVQEIPYGITSCLRFGARGRVA